MTMDTCRYTVKASYVLWFKIKDLHFLLEFVVNNTDLNDSNNNNSCFWNMIETKIGDFFSYITSESIIVYVIDQISNDADRKREIWNNYELLIEKLSELFLSKEYSIIYSYEEFINSINILFIFFENILKESMLSTY